MPAQIITDIFSYDVSFSALAPGGSSTQNFQVQADSDFKWTKGLFFADIAAAAQTQGSQVIPLCTVLITDQGSGRALSNVAIPLTSSFGFGYLPYILPNPRLFKARSVVAITISNFSAATTYNIRLTFAGLKMFSITSTG